MELDGEAEPHYLGGKILRWWQRKASFGAIRKYYLILWDGYLSEEVLTWDPQKHFEDQGKFEMSLVEDSTPEHIVNAKSEARLPKLGGRRPHSRSSGYCC